MIFDAEPASAVRDFDDVRPLEHEFLFLVLVDGNTIKSISNQQQSVIVILERERKRGREGGREREGGGEGGREGGREGGT